MAKKEKKPAKSGKAKLAEGAAKIKKAEQEAKQAKPEPVVLQPLTRSIQEIVRDRVTILDGSLGLELSKDTTIEENLAILGYATQMSDHVGFWVGDVLNAGQAAYGQKYSTALNQTGKALSTLKGYAEVARRIPPSQRVAALSYTHHRELIRLPDEILPKVLTEMGKKAEKGEAPSTAELRSKVKTSMPRKKKAPKKATSGKGKKAKKSKPEPPPYQPDDEEQAHMDAAEEALGSANEAIKSGGVFKIVAKCDSKEKQRWLQMIEPLVTFYNNLDRITGY